MARDCKTKVTAENSVLEAVGRTMQVGQELQVWATWIFCEGVQAEEDRVFQLLCYNFSERRRPHCGYRMQ